MSTEPTGGGPLSHVRVLDLGQGVAGPYCSQLLADQGATVIKVEPPRGDWGRTLGSSHAESGMSSTFIAVNRSKRGVCLDLSDERAAEATRRLARSCDVLVESFRPGILDRLGLGAERLRSENPDLVYCSVTGFGADGPMAGAPASDSMMQAYGGLMSIVGEPGGTPTRVGTVVSDMLAGGNAFAGVLLALLRKAAGQGGGRVEVTLLDSLLAFQSTGIADHLVSGRVPQPPGNRHPLIGASGVARASDGWLAVGVLDHYWDIFVELLDADALRDPRFATGAARLAAQDVLWEVLDAVLVKRSVGEWLELLRPAGIVCGPVQDYADLVQDPQVVHNRSLVPLPGGALVVQPPVRVDGVGAHQLQDPPRLGEHTREVLLGELAMDASEVDALVAAGVAIEG